MPYHLYDDEDNYLGPGPFPPPGSRARGRSSFDSMTPPPEPGPLMPQAAPAVPMGGLSTPLTSAQGQEGSIFGMSPNRFSTIAGLTAQAIAPGSIGGRLGASAAGLAIRDENMAYRTWLAQQRFAQARQRALAPGYTIPPEGRDPRQPYTAPLIPTQFPRVRPGEELVGPQPEGGLGPLYQSRRTPTQEAPPSTALGSSRPAYGEFPAVEGQFSPRQTIVPLSPGQAAYDPGTGETPYVAPLTPRQQQLRALAPGATQQGSLPEPDESFTAPLTPRQSIVPLGPGVTPYERGELGPTAPYSPRQQAEGKRVGRGLRGFKPGDVVLDAEGKEVMRVPLSPGKGSKPTAFSEKVEGWANYFTQLQDDPGVPSKYFDFKKARPARSRQQQAQEMMQKEKSADVKSAMAAALSQVFGAGQPQNIGPVDPLEGRTATGPGGEKIIRRNGQWVPYAP